ncbi:unnamed protein product [Ilex paraguariensis]|uniref:Homeobox-leucine zipper protein n=1 Tax=Ilex paraguariensis TaxID=185542 RepID=A0ABC8R231_9AQUA
MASFINEVFHVWNSPNSEDNSSLVFTPSVQIKSSLLFPSNTSTSSPENNEREREAKMTTSMHYQVDDQIALISQYYPGIYTQLVPEQEKVQSRRRRKKSKGDASSRSGVRKRKLRQEQVNILEKNFGNEHKLDSERKDRIASELELDPRQVAVWFQNRRARWKSKKMEEEYSKLKKENESTVVEKCRLETEVLKLKEQLSEADGKIQRLLERCNGVSSNIPCPLFSMNAMEPPFLGEFGMQGLENVFYVPENNYIHGLTEWALTDRELVLTGQWFWNNNLFGSIPDLSPLKQLAILHLEDNQLSGGIPQSLGNVDSLRELAVVELAMVVVVGAVIIIETVETQAQIGIVTVETVHTHIEVSARQ